MSNNLFSYATKELSQDAVINWILHENGLKIEFINDLLKYDACNKEIISPECVGSIIVNKEDNKEYIKSQYESMDILVLAKTKSGHTIAVIIEDKTNTSLHGNQVGDYSKKAKDVLIQYGGGDIHFILFKSGEYTFWEKDDYISDIQTSECKPIGHYYSADRLYDFLNKHNQSFVSSWKNDYLNYLQGKKIQFNWKTNLNNNLNQMKDDLVDNYDRRLKLHIDKAEGRGKRKDWGMSILGICGTAAVDKNSVEIEKNYYIYPYIKFREEGSKAVFYIQYNIFYGEKISEDLTGYIPRKTQLEDVKQRHKIQLEKLKKRFPSPETINGNSYLQVYKKTVSGILLSDVCSNPVFKKTLNEVINIAIEMEKTIINSGGQK